MVCVLTTLCVPLVTGAGNPLLAPELLRRDLPVIIQQMQLDQEQRAVLDLVFAEYLDAFEDARGETIAAIDAIEPESLHDAWRGTDWSAQHAAWAEARSAAAAIEDAAEATAWLDYHRQLAREEFDGILQRQPPPQPSLRTELLDDWRETRLRLRQGLLSDIELVIPPDQTARWDRVEWAIRRQRTPFAGVLAGENVDLGGLVRRQFAQEPAVLGSLAADLSAYERAWAEAAGKRDEVLTGLHARRLDAEERGDRLELLKVAQAEVASRLLVRDVNLAWFDRLGGKLPADALIEYQRRFNEAMHPDIFLSSQPARVSAWLLEQPDLPEDVRQGVVALRVRFGGPRLRAAANERGAERATAGRALISNAEQRAMAEVFGPTALFRLTESPQDAAQRRAASFADRRQQLDVSWMGQLRSLLGTEGWAALPTEVRLPPKSIRGVMLDEDGEPLRFVPTE
jgi:hypothetical protein